MNTLFNRITPMFDDADPGGGSLPNDPPADDTPAGDTPKPLVAAGDVEYTFAKIGEGDAAVDPPAELVTAVTEFAKANKLSPEQAQAVLSRELGSKKADVPEAYTFNKIKNDKDEEVDIPEDVTKPISEFATANSLTQEQAQALMDRELRLQDEALTAYNKQEADLQREWQEASRKDSEIGGEKFSENMGYARKALESYFPEISSAINDHPFLDSPEILRGLVKIGKLMSDDREHVISRNQPPSDKSAPWEGYYKNTKSRG